MSLLLSSISDIITSSDDDLSFLKALYKHIRNMGKVPDEMQLGHLAKAATPSTEVIIPYKLSEYGDCRLEGLHLKGIRKFPATDKRYYAIEFGGDEEYHSCVFLGANGVGKSSLYSAIEWASLGELDSAKNRGYITDEEQRDYLRYRGAEMKDCEIVLSCHKKDINVCLDTKDNRPISFPAFFCMEQDIAELSKKSYAKYIADQLGLKDFYNLLIDFDKLFKSYASLIDQYSTALKSIDYWGLIDSLCEKMRILRPDDLSEIKKAFYTNTKKFHKLKERNDNKGLILYSNDLRKQIQQLKDSLNNLFNNDPTYANRIHIHLLPFDEAGLNPLSNEGEWNFVEEERTKQFKNQLDKIYSDLSNFNFKKTPTTVAAKIVEEEARIHKLENKCSLLGADEQKVRDCEETYYLLKSLYRSYIDKLIEVGQTVFDTLFEQFLGNDIKSVSLERGADEYSLNIIIKALSPITHKEIGEVNPRLFLNTFRFKLFCVSVKVSLAICCSKFYGIEYPIVMDDIFDSSDFNNRERIRDFICNIFDCYAKLLNDKHPLQLIFFTQDDIVGDSVYRGIMDSYYDPKARYTRIFDFNEADEDEWHKTKPNDSDIETLTITDPIECAL